MVYHCYQISEKLMLTPSILKFLTMTLTALTFWAIDADAVSFFVDVHITDYMRIAQKLKQFLNVTAQNLSIVLTKFCAHAMHKARRKLCRACGLRQQRNFTSRKQSS